jgi:hypothetical protein
MKQDKNYSLYDMFSEIPDESLPNRFNEKLMLKINKEAIRHKRKMQIRSFTGYASIVVFMLLTAAGLFLYFGFSFEIPEIKIENIAFSKPSINSFKNTGFHLSLYIGTLALSLLIFDSIIRRHIKKIKHKDS